MTTTRMTTPTRRRTFRLAGGTAYGWLTVTPVLAVISLFTLFPFLYAAVNSLHQNILTLPGSPFVGLKNYRTALSDAAVQNSAVTSLIFVLIAVPLVVALGLAVAVLLSQSIKGFGILLVLVLLPWSVPTVSAGIMWRLLLHGEFGAIDGLLYRLGAIDSYVQWLSSSNLALASVALVHVWREFPLPAILFLAALQTIPSELHEAGRLDRATAWQRFRHITLPLLKAPLLIVLIYETMIAISAFDLVYVLTGGGPGSATTLFSWYVYTVTFKFLDLGQGAALSFIMAAVLILFIVAYARIVRVREDWT